MGRITPFGYFVLFIIFVTWFLVIWHATGGAR
jgi:hypothetical protein